MNRSYECGVAGRACASQTMAINRSSTMQPSIWVATLRQPGWSQKYSVSFSSLPSGAVMPVLTVTQGTVTSRPDTIFCSR